MGHEPCQEDTDGDGLADDAELDGVTDPTLADTDDDGLDDGEEPTYGTDPVDADTDDSLDGDEVLTHGSDPTARDTDGGGTEDGPEVGRGTDRRPVTTRRATTPRQRLRATARSPTTRYGASFGVGVHDRPPRRQHHPRRGGG